MSGLTVKHLPRPGRFGSRVASVRQQPALLVGAALGLLFAVHLLLPNSASSPVQHVAVAAVQQQLEADAGADAGLQVDALAGGGPVRGAGGAAATAGGGGSTARGADAATAAAAQRGAAAAGTASAAAAVGTAPAGAGAAATPAAAAAAGAGAAAGAPEGDWKALAATVPFTIVTGANSAYFGGLNNFVGSLHYWCPKCRLAVYDLGLSPDQLAVAKTWCNATVIRFAKPGGLHNYAWKPQVIYDASTRFGMATWLDAGCTITAPLDKAEAQIRADGVWNIQGQDDDMVRWAHEGMFQYLNQSQARFRKRPSFAGGLWGFVKGSPHYEHILKPWVQCSKTPACIQPSGSSIGNHRFDQSAVSIITYTTADTYNPDGTLMHKRLCPEASPGVEGACPPPLGLRVTPHTDLIAASSSQLKQGGCKGDASDRAIWTSRQGCSCYTDEAAKCTNIAGGAQQLPDFAEDTGMVVVP